ncbi:MAG: hypothetical protein HY752_07015 [Nitrospirae bacterium]|nr:hypothetical protein [Nitrospirota bacterium]
MDVIQAIKERRSINFFETEKEIPADKIIPNAHSSRLSQVRDNPSSSCI